ncbi:MAG: hypothetical protein NTU48_08050 [Legionellales bacterium]|nr:hypothetical protein [Legionellales bacterium]
MNNCTWLIVGVLGSVLSFDAVAWVAGGHGGGYYHGGSYGAGGYGRDGYYHGSYYNGWVAPGVVVGVPAGAYYGYGDCGHVSRCDQLHNCVTEYVCE